MSHETLWAEWKSTNSVDYVSWLEAKYAALEAEVASLRIAEQLKAAIALIREAAKRQPALSGYNKFCEYLDYLKRRAAV